MSWACLKTKFLLKKLQKGKLSLKTNVLLKTTRRAKPRPICPTPLPLLPPSPELLSNQHLCPETQPRFFNPTPVHRPLSLPCHLKTASAGPAGLGLRGAAGAARALGAGGAAEGQGPQRLDLRRTRRTRRAEAAGLAEAVGGGELRGEKVGLKNGATCFFCWKGVEVPYKEKRKRRISERGLKKKTHPNVI